MGDQKKRVTPSSAPKKISKIQFTTLKTEEIRKSAELQISNRDIFQMPMRTPAIHGVLDPRLGISDKQSNCLTCNKKMADCAGHFGYIQLELPVFHAGYFRHTLTILQCICKKCSRVLLPIPERAPYLRRMRNPRSDALAKASAFKRVVEACKKNTVCPHCKYSNGVVKKLPGSPFKILHEKHRARHPEEEMEALRRVGEIIGKTHPDLRIPAARGVEPLSPLRAYELLRGVREEDAALLWMDGTLTPPDSLIVWSLAVPPVPIRPSVPQDGGGGSTEDDLTVKLQEIIEMNNALRLALEQGASIRMVEEDWEYLQIQVALFVNGEAPGIPRQLMGPKPVRGLCQRLKGKQGRFRGNLSGKRVDFSGRTVISPDPNIRVDQVGIPMLVAKILTYPERVNRYNIERLRITVMNGPEVHPGASIVRNDNLTLSLHYGDRKKVAANLRIGDIVERHMIDDDLVLFNRQPSLHRMSIMAHRVRVYPWRTFRFNECACTPYNADFDGDEMNIHFPQTEEARAEAAQLMAITHNLITPRNGEPLVAATQDFLTGSYLLTQKDIFLTRAEICKLVAYLSDANEHIELPPPTLIKPRMLWTGKQVFSLLIRPNRLSQSFVNLESEEKFYTSDQHFCPQDGFVAFRNGELVSGNLGKKTLGGESKCGLFYVLIRDYGAQEAVNCMSRVAKLCARFCGDRGFSISVEDVTPSPRMLALKQRIMTDGQKQALDQIDQYQSGRIKLKPGCNALQSLESEVNGILGKIRETCGKEALIALNHRNAPLCMAQCGSKGSPLNISQMIACLGQQSVGGSRIQNGFVNRTLPHFPPGSLSPDARGFVANSFYSGLTATEFFFHTMGGREGLVDTAVKTAETGYMARRLMKALEDLSLQYDGTVRNSEKTVVQFVYGDDGLNPQVMEKRDRPVDYDRLLTNTHSLLPDPLSDSMTADQLDSAVRFELSQPRFTSLLPQGALFLDETLLFFRERANRLRVLERLAREGMREAERDGKGGMEEEEAGIEEEKGGVEEKVPVRVKVEGIKGEKEGEGEETAGSDSDLPPLPIPSEPLHVLRTRLSQLSLSSHNFWLAQAKIPGSQAFLETHRLLRENTVRLTPAQLAEILDRALRKFHMSKAQAGEAVGAVGAQSLSEPGTQMTLKTFHFAGVASMNVTLGVPRLKEIINGSKLISTPIIEARLVQSSSPISARIAKAQIEKTTLGSVCCYIKEVHTREQSYLSVKLDLPLLKKLHLNVTGLTVRQAILACTGVKSPSLRLLKDRHVIVTDKKCSKLRIFAPEPKDSSKGLPAHKRIYFMMQTLKADLAQVIVKGIPSVSRAIINEEMDSATGKKQYYLLVEGYGMREVMNCPGVDGRLIKSNHIMEMQSVLGIEAARLTISNEIKYIMTAYGITVDRRHLMLLSDVMTFKGEVLGITRFGVAKMKESVLMLASFEKTTDHLFDASVHAREDSVVGVSECIIMGVPVPIGTGLFKLLQRAKADGLALTSPKTSSSPSSSTSLVSSSSSVSSLPPPPNTVLHRRRQRLMETI